ncbi:hypothetical protein ACFQ8C_21640 [Streptomyces sp. NPDC056503]|uniref:hypothetical protein n=1 Tax=Streptomyces sp. NPDC056503 TaxID=3345842 RepID=UPI00367E68CF
MPDVPDVPVTVGGKVASAAGSVPPSGRGEWAAARARRSTTAVTGAGSQSPREKTSVAEATGSPGACSGDMYCGVPMIRPPRVIRVTSAARAMPKSMTYGPVGAGMMLPGSRSRRTAPATWIEAGDRAAQPTSGNTARSGSGPKTPSASWSVMPGTKAGADQGEGPEAS